MDLVQCRIVSDDVEGLAGFYARLLDMPAALNEYYVEIQAGPASVGFSRRRFTGEEMTMHDHSKLGRELELFDTDPLIGAGLPYWLPDAQLPEAEALAAQAVGEGLRAMVARPESGSLGARIRASRVVPHQPVIGSREAADGQVALRLRYETVTARRS